MIVYVNGDSYTATSDGKRYSDFLGEKLKCQSINAAVAGSCNSRITRTSLRDLIDLKKQQTKIVAVISISFTLRTEVWNESLQADKWKQSNDGGFGSYQFATSHNWLLNKDVSSHIPYNLKSFGREWLMNYDIEAETTNLLKDCVFLVNWLQNNQIPYVIFSGCPQEPIDVNAPFVKPFYNELSADKNVIDFYSQSFTEWCLSQGHTPYDDYQQNIHGVTKIIGHHREAAHSDWANYLLENYLNEI